MKKFLILFSLLVIFTGCRSRVRHNDNFEPKIVVLGKIQQKVDEQNELALQETLKNYKEIKVNETPVKEVLRIKDLLLKENADKLKELTVNFDEIKEKSGILVNQGMQSFVYNYYKGKKELMTKFILMGKFANQRMK